MKNIKAIRSRRLSEEISATALAKQADIDRGRHSFLENGHLQATDDELRRLNAALDALISARRKVQAFAAEVGLPSGISI